jgi:hypothetical protein
MPRRVADRRAGGGLTRPWASSETLHPGRIAGARLVHLFDEAIARLSEGRRPGVTVKSRERQDGFWVRDYRETSVIFGVVPTSYES